MYLGTRPSLDEASPPSEALRNLPKVSRNVVMLGFTSMFTDISTEMVVSVLPLLFVVQLGFSPLQFGAVDGVYQGLGGRPVRASRPLPPIDASGTSGSRGPATGYRPAPGSSWSLASGSWVPVLGSIYLDRLGKGIRTAPRDALISLSSAARPARRLVRSPPCVRHARRRDRPAAGSLPPGPQPDGLQRRVRGELLHRGHRARACCSSSSRTAERRHAPAQPRDPALDHGRGPRPAAGSTVPPGVVAGGRLRAAHTW